MVTRGGGEGAVNKLVSIRRFKAGGEKTHRLHTACKTPSKYDPPHIAFQKGSRIAACVNQPKM